MIEKRSINTKQHLFAFLLFVLFSSFWLWPLPVKIAENLPASHDIWLSIWNFWWMEKSIFDMCVSPMHTDFVFYPVGVSLYFHALSPVNSIAGAVLQKIINSVFAYNVLFFLTFILSGYFLTLLCYRFTGNFTASVIAGYIYAFSPFHFSHIEQLDHLSIQWPVLLTYALFQLIERAKKRYSLFAAVSFALVFYTNFYYGLFSIILIISFIIYDTAVKNIRKNFWFWIIFAAAFLIMTAPYAVNMFLESRMSGRFAVPLWIKVHQSLDAAALFTPSLNHPILSNLSIVQKAYSSFTAWENIGYLGFSVIILSSVSLFRNKFKYRNFLFILAALFVILSLGPVLHIFGIVLVRNTPIPLPQYFIQIIPVIGEARVPSRYLSFAMIFISILSGIGVKRLLESHNKKSLFAGILLISALIFEYWNKPLELTTPRYPEWCSIIAEDTEDCVVMDLPLRISEDSQEWWRAFDPANDRGWFQTIYNKRSMTGPISHTALRRENFTYFLNDERLRKLVGSNPHKTSDSFIADETQRVKTRRVKTRRVKSAGSKSQHLTPNPQPSTPLHQLLTPNPQSSTLPHQLPNSPLQSPTYASKSSTSFPQSSTLPLYPPTDGRNKLRPSSNSQRLKYFVFHLDVYRRMNESELEKDMLIVKQFFEADVIYKDENFIVMMHR